jgi:hypothetical protein
VGQQAIITSSRNARLSARSKPKSAEEIKGGKDELEEEPSEEEEKKWKRYRTEKQ